MPNETMLNHALRYAAAGYPVIPLCWPEFTIPVRCGCGKNHPENNIGKAPITAHGLTDATLTQQGVRDYWTKWPKANIGVVIPEGFFVLDVDAGHGGYDSLAILQERIGELPETLLIGTGAGGQHFWYRTTTPVRNTVKLGMLPGLDIRGVGGYVVAPPSIHRSGHQYQRSEIWPGPATYAPQSLIDLCGKTQGATTTAPLVPEVLSEGSRNATLTSLAGSMRRRGLSMETIYLSLKEVNQAQCKPPLPDADIQTIARSVSRYAPTEPQGRYVRYEE